MGAPLGTRICPVLGCSRRIHVSTGGTVSARCLMHTLLLLSGAFAEPRHAVQQGLGGRDVPPAPASGSLPAGEPVAAGAMPR